MACPLKHRSKNTDVVCANKAVVSNDANAEFSNAHANVTVVSANVALVVSSTPIAKANVASNKPIVRKQTSVTPSAIAAPTPTNAI